MKRFFTGKFVGVTLLNVIALAVLISIPNRTPALNRLLAASSMAPLYFVFDSLMKAVPRADKPSDDGMYSIAGVGLQAIEEANAQQADWTAVAFYTAYACFILAVWFVTLHYFPVKVTAV